jgi:hypothetical protein
MILCQAIGPGNKRFILLGPRLIVANSGTQDKIANKHPAAHRSMFVPIILGSDKTTVSVATGHNEYYPLYISTGNVHNNVRRSHRGAVALLAFLAIPKSVSVLSQCKLQLTRFLADKKHSNDPKFRKFRRQVFHSSLAKILQSLKPGMTKPEVACCADGHFRRVVYGLGPYIADYPEQVLLTCIVQGWCARYQCARF